MNDVENGITVRMSRGEKKFTLKKDVILHSYIFMKGSVITLFGQSIVHSYKLGRKGVQVPLIPSFLTNDSIAAIDLFNLIVSAGKKKAEKKKRFKIGIIFSGKPPKYLKVINNKIVLESEDKELYQESKIVFSEKLFSLIYDLIEFEDIVPERSYKIYQLMEKQNWFT